MTEKNPKVSYSTYIKFKKKNKVQQGLGLHGFLVFKKQCMYHEAAQMYMTAGIRGQSITPYFFLSLNFMTYSEDCNNDENSRRRLQKEKIQLSQIRQHPFDRKCDRSCGAEGS